MKKFLTIPAGLAVLAFCLGFKKIVDLDFWWHLSAGRWMWQNHAVVTKDPFSHTALGDTWVSITWGYEFIIFAIQHLTGAYWPVTAFHALLAAATIVTCWKTYEQLRGEEPGKPLQNILAFALFLAAITAIEIRWINRPEIFTHLLGSVVIFLLVKNYFGRLNPKHLWLIPLIQVLWVNTHGIFIFGPILVGLFWFSSFVFAESRAEAAFKSKLLPVLGATMFACLLNPRGLTGALFPFHLLNVLTHQFYQRTIPEATNPFRDAIWGYDTWALAIWMALAVLIPLAIPYKEAVKKYSLGFFILAAELAWTSISARRNIALFFVWTLPFIVEAWSFYLTVQINKRWALPVWVEKPMRWAPAALIPIFVAMVVTNYYRHPQSDLRFGGEISKHNYPQGAIDYLTAKGINGTWFANVEFADYAMYKMPGFRPYIDGRFAELYVTEHFRRYMDILAQPTEFDSEVKKMGIDLVGMTHSPPLAKPLIGYLISHPEWRLIFVDDNSVVFMRRDKAEAFKAALDESPTKAGYDRMLAQIPRTMDKKPAGEFFNARYELYDWAKPYVEFADAATMLNDVETAGSAAGEAILRNPQLSYGYAALCRIEFLKLSQEASQTKNFESQQIREGINKVEEYCGTALRLGADRTSVRQIQGLLYMNTGRPQEAIEAFKDVVRRDPISYEGHLMLARAYSSVQPSYTENTMQKALETYQRASNLRPLDPNVWIEIGMFHENTGQPDQAIQFYQRSMQIRPSLETEHRIKAVERRMAEAQKQGARKPAKK